MDRSSQEPSVANKATDVYIFYICDYACMCIQNMYICIDIHIGYFTKRRTTNVWEAPCVQLSPSLVSAVLSRFYLESLYRL